MPMLNFTDLSESIEILTRQVHIKSAELYLYQAGNDGILDLEPADLSKIDKYTFHYNGAFVKFPSEIAAKYFFLYGQWVINTALTIVLKTTGDAPIQWNLFETPETAFFPIVYRVKSAEVRLLYEYGSPLYVRKESSCTAGHVGVLLLDAGLNRIEYGTISAQNQMVMHELDIKDEK